MQSNPASYVYLLASLPEHPPITFDTQNERYLFAAMRNACRARSLWLRHLLLGEELKLQHLCEGTVQYRHTAEISVAMFQLALGIYLRTSNEVLLEAESPGELWFCWERFKAQAWVDHSGLMGEPLLTGKRATRDGIRRFCLSMETLTEEWDPAAAPDNLDYIITCEARTIAARDPKFKKQYLLPFLSTVRNQTKRIHDCGELQHCNLLPDGTLFVTSKDVKLPLM